MKKQKKNEYCICIGINKEFIKVKNIFFLKRIVCIKFIESHVQITQNFISVLLEPSTGEKCKYSVLKCILTCPFIHLLVVPISSSNFYQQNSDFIKFSPDNS